MCFRSNQNKKKKIWENVGLIIHLSQMIEYNIANIIAGYTFLSNFEIDNSKTIEDYFERSFLSNIKLYDLNDKKTMGYLLGAAKKANVFDSNFEKQLDSIKQTRDYYAHTFFKEALFSNKIEMEPDSLIASLNKTIEEFSIVNEKLLIIDSKQRRQATEIKRHFKK